MGCLSLEMYGCQSNRAVIPHTGRLLSVIFRVFEKIVMKHQQRCTTPPSIVIMRQKARFSFLACCMIIGLDIINPNIVVVCHVGTHDSGLA